MTNKEYKQKLMDHDFYNGRDYLTAHETCELSHDIANRKKSGDIVLDGFNRRASITPVNGGYILTSYYTIVAEFTEKGDNAGPHPGPVSMNF